MKRACREEEYDHLDDSSVDLSDLEDGDDDDDEYGDITSGEEDINGDEDKMGVPPSSLTQRDMSAKKERLQGNIKGKRRNIPGRMKFDFIK
eukprot:14162228-Ditylum_brightwellii.AAC.1